MYAPSYGYAPGNPQTPFNPNGAPVNPHQQQLHQPGQQHPGQQPQMFNPQQQQQQQQQYAVSGQPHQSPYGGAQGPGMGGNAGGMGMMPNNGMAQMGGGGGGGGSHVPAYQTPYSSSPYGASIPTSSSSNLPPNFMPTSSGAPSFPMNASNMNHPQQHQGQRMQPPPNVSTPTSSGPRASPFGGVQHNTPPNAGSAPSQFATPQASNQAHLQTPNNQQSQTIVTPQTPNFPPGSQGGTAGPSMVSPLSPGSEIREQQRVTCLLEINQVLLRESVAVQTSQALAKKEELKEGTASPDESEKEKERVKAAASQKGYIECMRRLQANLAYLAAIADRSHKPSSQIPPHPAIMTAPLISSPAPPPPKAASDNPEDSKEEADDWKPDDDEDRSETLKSLYKKLQDLFPGVDPKKEPVMAANPAARQQAMQQAQQQQAQNPGQNDLMRQKMLQAQQQSQPMMMNPLR